MNGLGKKEQRRLAFGVHRTGPRTVRKRRCAFSVCMVHACQQERAAVATVVQLTQSLRHCLRLCFDSSSKHLRCCAPPNQSEGAQRPSAEQVKESGALHTPVCHDASHLLAIDIKKVICTLLCTLCTLHSASWFTGARTPTPKSRSLSHLDRLNPTERRRAEFTADAQRC